MKKTVFVIVLMAMALMLSSCGKNLFTKPEPIQPIQPKQEIQKEEKIEKEKTIKENIVVVKMDDARTMRSILQEILANGELVDKDIHAKRFGSYEYTWEMWIIKENTGDFHVAIIENGTLINISPANDLEDARRKFEPYGGWKD
jgi:hypothetical protein